MSIETVSRWRELTDASSDFGMVFAHGQVVWRFPVAFLIVFGMASTALLYPLPDPPRYYYASGRETEADKTLGRLCVDLPEKTVSTLWTKTPSN